MDSYTTETHMVHDETIQPKQILHSIFSCETFIHYDFGDGFHMMKLNVRNLVAIS